MDRIFKALNDPTRRSLLDALRRQDGQTLRELERDPAQGMGMTRFGVMKHLAVLEEAGLVVTLRRGRFKHHYLNVLPLQEVLDRWIEPLLRKPAARGILDLKRHLEGQTVPETDAKPAFVMETYIRCSQDALWAALTSPDEVPHYHFMASAARGTLGAPGDAMEFLLADGSALLTTRATAIDPRSRIEVTFEPHWGDDRRPTRVAYRIEPRGRACKLTVEHYGLTPEAMGIRDGWARLVSGLKSRLESGQAHRFDAALLSA